MRKVCAVLIMMAFVLAGLLATADTLVNGPKEFEVLFDQDEQEQPEKEHELRDEPKEGLEPEPELVLSGQM